MAFSDPTHVIRHIGIYDGMTVADFGAGTGYYTFLASDLVGEDGMVYAFDIQKELLLKIENQARGLKRDNITTQWADLDEENGSGLHEATIDVVLIANTLFQIEKRDAIIKEAYRVLKNKGRLVVVDWAESYGGMGPQPQDVLKKERAQELCERGGFLLDREIEAGEHHYGLIFKKIL